MSILSNIIRNTILNILLLMLIQGLTFSQGIKEEIYVEHPFSSIIFESNNIIKIFYTEASGDEISLEGFYKLIEKFGIPFLDVSWTNGKKETFLILKNELMCFLYNSDSNPKIFGFSGAMMRSEWIQWVPEKITATSYLVENGLSYFPNNTSVEIGKPWVEGANGQGIHEKLFIIPSHLTPQMGCTAIYISIGFVSYDKPCLYKENSRPKKLNISVENKFSFIVYLIDTPHFQTIKLPQTLIAGDELVIEILDVFPGTKYDDTCINCILYDTYP